MSGWTAKRFWSEVSVISEGEGYAIRLDSREAKTPAKAPLVVPTGALAEAICAEWSSVESVINPRLMPFTSSANAAIDKVAPQFVEVADMIAAYGASDLLCYRAEGPDALVARQAEQWDPLLDWAAAEFGAVLHSTVGIMPVEQPEQSVASLRAQVHGFTSFELTAFHDLVAMSGSLIIGLAVTRGHLQPQEAWAASRIDEIWQAEQWGQDDDAMATAEIKRTAFSHAARFFRLSKNEA